MVRWPQSILKFSQNMPLHWNESLFERNIPLPSSSIYSQLIKPPRNIKLNHHEFGRHLNQHIHLMGPFETRPRILKEDSFVLADRFTVQFQQRPGLGALPAPWKWAIIDLISKKSGDNQRSGCRPASLNHIPGTVLVLFWNTFCWLTYTIPILTPPVITVSYQEEPASQIISVSCGIWLKNMTIEHFQRPFLWNSQKPSMELSTFHSLLVWNPVEQVLALRRKFNMNWIFAAMMGPCAPERFLYS